MRLVGLIVSGLVLTGCYSERPKAPSDVDDLTRFLFREWAYEDPEVLAEGIEKLEKYLETLDMQGRLVDRSFSMESITEDDLFDVNAPEGQDPSKTIGSAVAFESRWPVTDHAKLQASGDILEAEPSASKYKRRFIDPTDPSCFPTRECREIYTDNDITRKNLLMSIDMMLHKNFRWVELSSGRFAMISRSWAPKVFRNDDKAIFQTFAIDVWIERPKNKSWRYQALYQEADVGIDADDSTVIGTITSSTDGMFEDTDDVIGERYHGE